MRILLNTIKIDNFIYTFLDSNQNNISLKLEFHDFKLELGDILVIDEKLLEDIKNGLAAFGKLNNKAGRNLLNLNSNQLLLETIEIHRNDDIIYLKRLYG